MLSNYTSGECASGECASGECASGGVVLGDVYYPLFFRSTHWSLSFWDSTLSTLFVFFHSHYMPMPSQSIPLYPPLVVLHVILFLC